MPRNFRKIIPVLFGLLFVGSVLAQTVSFPNETMLSRIERIAEIAKENEKSITYETRFLQGISANSFKTTSESIETWLRLSLENTPLTYRKINAARFIIVRRIDEKPTDGNLAGKITDTFGTPLAGATVWVQSIQKGTITGLNGDYALSLSAGSFTVEVRFLGYEPIQVNSIEISTKQTTRLDVALKETNVSLNEIVITKTLPENSLIGALNAQRNTPYVSSVLSVQEIERSASNTVRNALQLIPGVTSSENGDIIIRGTGGRWNEIALNGIPMPNYDPSYKIFSFDLLPISLVDNIRLLKSSTPDISTSFGSAMIDIVTKDIPEHNFVQLKTEIQLNTQSSFQNQRGRKRGKWDFMGLDDGSREIPQNGAQVPAEHFRIYDRKTPPSQHHSLTIGRTHTLANTNNRFGLLFSISCQNTQQQSVIEHTQRGRWNSIGQYTSNMSDSRNAGFTYGYNTVSGGMFNAGWQFGKNRISLRNILARSFENNLTEISQHLEDIPDDDKNLSRQFFNYPTFSNILQNKLDGKHTIGNNSVQWNVSHTLMKRERKDAAFSEMYKPLRDDSLLYFLHANPQLKEIYPASSGQYANREQNFRMGISAMFPLNRTNRFTFGYDGSYKRIRYEYSELMLRYRDSSMSEIYQTFEQYDFNKTVVEHFPFAMVEHRWNEKFRFVWGARANYESIVKKWDFMPTVNLTFTPAKALNIKMGYRRLVIRPQLADYIPYPVYDTQLLGTSVNRPIRSSLLQSVDFQVEKQMGAFDFISFGLFYRYIKHPIERTTYEYRQDERMYVLQNSNKAINYGFEANVRKQLDFVADADFMRNIQLITGFTLTRSSVEGRRMAMKDKDAFIETESTQKRPLSGQMPYLLNIGFNYSDKNINANILFKRSGRQLFLLGENAHTHEYRAPFNSLEASIGYRFPKSGILLKLGVSNLLNAHEIFYTNTPDDYVRDEYNFPTDNLLPRKTENYDKGRDPIVHKIRGGHTVTFSVSGTF
ncbi:MAG: TonB-dependent receptor [Bacteroidia bacterium]|nr:TonB-dependent receptor [Bacteroidia bacterium]